MLALEALRHCLPAHHLGAWLAAAVAGTVLMLRVFGSLRTRRRRVRAWREVLRAASEVASIASALESDLARLQDDAKCQSYRLRCARLRARADIALAEPARVRQLPLRRLMRAASRFRSDLRKLKQFRLEVQVVVSSWDYARGVRPPQSASQRAKNSFALGYRLAS